MAQPQRGDVDDIASVLCATALFAGTPHEELIAFAAAFRRFELAAGEVLWHQASAVEGLHVLVRGAAQVCRRLPGERELELARLGPGDVMGEIPLLGGGTHSATVRALEPCLLLFLSRGEFAARTLSRQPIAIELRRRIVAIACARLRRIHRVVAASLDAVATSDAAPVVAVVGSASVGDALGPQPAEPPPRSYLARLPLLRDLGPDLVAALLACGETHDVPRGTVLLAEGAEPAYCYITLNGAVEDVARRSALNVRVDFAGPGHPFGYLGLLDGGASSVTSVARERCRVLSIPAPEFVALMDGQGEHSRTFAAAVECDLMASLRNAERPQSYQAVAGTP